MQARDYPVVVEPLPESKGGGFVAYAPDLPGSLSDGDTPDEALRNAYDAIAVWLERAITMGRALPQPSPQRRTA
ncbi:MAG: type II toxin-antitoxin system HicB family antitoxin [Sphingomonadaceae bacterium]|nr:type II toxin-antitoxin system HicB family antitoxin [Sphingomonadaceae bacterium]